MTAKERKPKPIMPPVSELVSGSTPDLVDKALKRVIAPEAQPPGTTEEPPPAYTGDQQTLVTQSPVAHQTPVSISHPYLEPERNYTKVPNVVFDKLAVTLDPYEFKVYMRLFRLSHGFRKDHCTVGYKALAQGCSLSIRHIKRIVSQLTAKGWIGVLEVYNTKEKKGTRYAVYTSVQQTPVSNSHQCPTDTGVHQSPNKSDDSLKENDNHHQRETMRVYTSITYNEWKQSDQVAYTKIKNVPLDKIEQGIQLASQRAPSRPNSLNYFVKEILSQANPSALSRAQRKRELEKVVKAVRALHVGEQGYTFPDFVEDVKRRCARDGVLFDNDLFNEIIG